MNGNKINKSILGRRLPLVVLEDFCVRKVGCVVFRQRWKVQIRHKCAVFSTLLSYFNEISVYLNHQNRLNQVYEQK